MRGTREEASRPGFGSAGWSLLRIGAGLLLFRRGYRNLFSTAEDGSPRILQVIDTLAAHSIPAPDTLAWLLSMLALGGGALLAAGFYTRPLAAVWALVSGVALAFSQGYGATEALLLQLAVGAAFLLGGAGGFSVDEALRQRRERLSSSLFRRSVGPLR